MSDQVLINTTLLDMVTVNGRISKKLFEKVVNSHIDDLEMKIKAKDEVIKTLDNICSNDIRNLKQQLKETQEKLDLAVEALEKAVNSGEFFLKHADCTRDSWACKCSFCRDTYSSKNLREARETLTKIKE